MHAVRTHARAEATRLRRGTAAIATIFAGTLGVLVLLAQLPVASVVHAAPAVLLGEALVGGGALLVLGARAWRASFGRAPSLAHLAAAVPVATGTLAAALLWTALFRAEGAAPELPAGGMGDLPLLLALVLVAVATPLGEEWLCRGLLWVALRPLTGRGVTIVVSAALFALLHGLNGGYLLEVPHRFVAGLGFGWLRDRSGSVWPAVLAHALHNAGAVLLDP